VEKQRIIAHFDLDSFFVSVEVLNNPTLKGKPVIVGGNERGVVAACSYEARKYGIHSAMPSVKAKQLCPHAIFLKGSFSEYSRYSRWVTDIIASKAPLFEKASIDEFYLDLTGLDTYFEPLQWTLDLREQIMTETGLPISFGLSCNKMIAKMATNEAKPNGYLYVPFGKERDFLSHMSPDKIPGVGPQTFSVLKAMDLLTIGDIAASDPDELEDALGKWGRDLWQKSMGIHESEVCAYAEAKSISAENTFQGNLSHTTEIHKELVRLTEKVCFELRLEEKVAGCVAVKIRYPDFETHTRQSTIPYTSADDEIIPVVATLFKQLHQKRSPIRLLGVRLSDLTNDVVQTNLFHDVEKKTDLYKAIDGVKHRFGKSSVRRASSGDH